MGDLLRLPPPINPARHVIYVYGTLRTGVAARLYAIPGALYDLGSYPGAILYLPNVQHYILCERIIVDDDRLSQIDTFEGFKPDDPKSSLFIRKKIYDGWIYTYNHTFSDKIRIKGSGDDSMVADWLDWCNLHNKSGLRPLGIRGTNVLGDITTTEPTAPQYDEVMEKAKEKAKSSTSVVVPSTDLVVVPVKKKRLLGLYSGGAK